MMLPGFVLLLFFFFYYYLHLFFAAFVPWAISFCFFNFFWDIFFFCAISSSGLGTIFFFSKVHLNVVRRAHVWVDLTMSAVSSVPYLGGIVHLAVFNDQRLYIYIYIKFSFAC